MYEDVVELRRKFHQIPELGFEEFETSALIKEILEWHEISYIADVAGTGITVSFGEGHPHIAFRAEIDGLPIQEENNLSFRSKRNGFMHACGHDCHIAALVGTALQAKKLFDANKLKGRVTFIFQPSEETTNQKNLSGGQIISRMPEMMDVDNYYSAHVESTLENGKVYIRDGALTAAIDRFDLDIIGKAGHGAYPHNTVDPIWLAANIMQMINTLESRIANTAFPSVISICTITGGTAWNIVPDKVSMSGTIRTFNQEEREKIHDCIKKCCEITKLFGGDYVLNIAKGNPSVINNPVECNVVRTAAAKVMGEDVLSNIDIQMGGDDFSHYAILKPSCYFYMGAKKDNISRQHHSSNFDVDESVIANIVKIFLAIIEEKLS